MSYFKIKLLWLTMAISSKFSFPLHLDYLSQTVDYWLLIRIYYDEWCFMNSFYCNCRPIMDAIPIKRSLIIVDNLCENRLPFPIHWSFKPLNCLFTPNLRISCNEISIKLIYRFEGKTRVEELLFKYRFIKQVSLHHDQIGCNCRYLMSTYYTNATCAFQLYQTFIQFMMRV